MKTLFKITLPVMILIGLFYRCAPQKPKNVIIMVADGCGYNHIAAAGMYDKGVAGKQIYEQFPVQYAVTTFSLNNPVYVPDSAWSRFDYVLKKPTDSAASATAMATGVKTRNGMIGMDSSGVIVENVLERLENYGKTSGVITTVPLSHATPAGFSVHNVSRKHYEEIARSMVLESSMEVLMGAGHPFYDGDGKISGDTSYRYVGGEETWLGLTDGSVGGDGDGDGSAEFWTLLTERKRIQQLMEGKTPQRVLYVAPVGATLQEGRSGDSQAEPFSVPLNNNVPTLAEMTRAAINVLDEDPTGFILMIEGGAVDWAAHANLSGRMIEEQLDFTRAVETVADWVESNSSWDETLVIVTADHETGYLTGPVSNDSTLSANAARDEIWKPLINNGEGKVPGMQWNTNGHTNSLIPLFAKGTGSERFSKYVNGIDPVRGKYIDDTSIAKVIFEMYPAK